MSERPQPSEGLPKVEFFDDFTVSTPFAVGVDKERLGQFLQEELGMSQDKLSNLIVRFYRRRESQEYGPLVAGRFIPGLNSQEKDLAAIFVGSLVEIARDYQTTLMQTQSLEKARSYGSPLTGLEFASGKWDRYLKKVPQARGERLTELVLDRKVGRAILMAIAHECAHALFHGDDPKTNERKARELVDGINLQKWGGIIEFESKQELVSSF